MGDEDRKVINEFCHLLEKAKQLFNGLRDLPQYGHKQWQSYFGRTFDVYNKLWKFQQQNRQLLDTMYGLKRWQIGEIASKIGQLYYHYYLRTSETHYLNESFNFYTAIKIRSYYSKASKDERPDLMVKKLRFYARFIVVCLLLQKTSLVHELVKEFDKQVEDYVKTYEPEDQLEWSLVLSEIKSFVDADNLVSVVRDDGTEVLLRHRLTPEVRPELEKGATVFLTLQEIIVVGNNNDQVKFSELTLDMFHMLQCLELEPPPEDSNKAPLMQQEGTTLSSKGDNPHKYLLYKPTFGQLGTFLATSFKELPPNAAMLLYLSAEGVQGSSKQAEDVAYDLGGVQTNSRREGAEVRRAVGNIKNVHCVHPGDLYAYTRKPLFLIVDSDNSSAFQHFPNHFGQPFMALLSPEQLPSTIRDDAPTKGSLLTAFLYSPLSAFCYACGVTSAPETVWQQGQTLVNRFIHEAAKLLVKSRNIDHAVMQFYGDGFLRTLIIRFVFCHATLRLHRGFKGPGYYPVSQPPLPAADLLEHPALIKMVLDLSQLLEVRGLFGDLSEVD